MRVHVDSEKCQGHNRCYAITPELFDVDDFGMATATGGEVPRELEAKARLAVANCPEFAIAIIPACGTAPLTYDRRRERHLAALLDSETKFR